MLQISIDKAINLPLIGLNKPPTAYCSIKSGNQLFYTDMIPDQKNPIWQSNFKFQPDSTVTIIVYNSNKTDVDQILGKVTIPIEQLQTSNISEHQYFLDNQTSKINIRSRFEMKKYLQIEQNSTITVYLIGFQDQDNGYIQISYLSYKKSINVQDFKKKRRIAFNFPKQLNSNDLIFSYKLKNQKQDFDRKLIDLQSLSADSPNYRNIILNNFHNNRPKHITCSITFYKNNYVSLGMRTVSVFIKQIKTSKFYLIKINGALSQQFVYKQKPMSKHILLQDEITLQYFFNKGQKDIEQCKYLAPNYVYKIYLSQINWQKQSEKLWITLKPQLVINNHFENIDLEIEVQLSKGQNDQLSLYKQPIKPSILPDEEVSLFLSKITLMNSFIHQILPNKQLYFMVTDSHSNVYYSNSLVSGNYSYNLESRVIASPHTNNCKITIVLLSCLPYMESDKNQQIFKAELDVKKISNSKTIDIQGQFVPSFAKYAKKYCLSHHQQTKKAAKMLNQNSVLLKVQHNKLRGYKDTQYAIQLKNIVKTKGNFQYKRKLKIVTMSESYLFNQKLDFMLISPVNLTIQSQKSICFQLWDNDVLISEKYQIVQQLFSTVPGTYKTILQIQDSVFEIFYKITLNINTRTNKVLTLSQIKPLSTFSIKLKNLITPSSKSFYIQIQSNRTKYRSKVFKGIHQNKLQLTEGGIFQFQSKSQQKYLFCSFISLDDKIQIFNGYIDLTKPEFSTLNKGSYCVKLQSIKKPVQHKTTFTLQISPLPTLSKSKLTLQHIITQSKTLSFFKDSTKYYFSIQSKNINHIYEILPPSNKLNTQNIIFSSSQKQITLSNINDLKYSQSMSVNQSIEISNDMLVKFKILIVNNINQLKSGKQLKYQIVAEGYKDIRQIKYSKINYGIEMKQIFDQQQSNKFTKDANIVDKIWLIINCEHTFGKIQQLPNSNIPTQFVPKAYLTTNFSHLNTTQQQSQLFNPQNQIKFIKRNYSNKILSQHLLNHSNISFYSQLTKSNTKTFTLKDLNSKYIQKFISELQFQKLRSKYEMKFWSNRITQYPQGTLKINSVEFKQSGSSNMLFKIFLNKRRSQSIKYEKKYYNGDVQKQEICSGKLKTGNVLYQQVSIQIMSIKQYLTIVLLEGDSIVFMEQIEFYKLKLQKLSTQQFVQDSQNIKIKGNYVSSLLGEKESLTIKYYQNDNQKTIEHIQKPIVNFIKNNDPGESIQRLSTRIQSISYNKLIMSKQQIKFQGYLQNISLCFMRDNVETISVPKDKYTITYLTNISVIHIESCELIIKQYPTQLKLKYLDSNKQQHQIIGQNIDNNNKIGRYLFESSEFVSVKFIEFKGRVIPQHTIFELHLHRLVSSKSTLAQIQSLPNDEVVTKAFKIFIEYNNEFNVSSTIDNYGIFKQFQTQTYGYNPHEDTITFKLIIDNCLNQNIEFDYDKEDWMKQMVICKGHISLRQILSSNQNMYFWINMEACRVGQVSIASSFQKILKRQGLCLLGQVKMKQLLWGYIEIKIDKILKFELDQNYLVWIELAVINKQTKKVIYQFCTDHIRGSQTISFQNNYFITKIMSQQKNYLALKLYTFGNGIKTQISQKRIQLTQILKLNQPQTYKLQIKPEQTQLLKNITIIPITLEKKLSIKNNLKLIKTVQESKIDIGDFRKATDAELITVLLNSTKKTHMFETLSEIKQSLIYVVSDRSALIRTLFFYILVYKTPEVIKAVSECVSLSFLKTKNPFENMKDFDPYLSIKQCVSAEKPFSKPELQLKQILQKQAWSELLNLIASKRQQTAIFQSESLRYLLDFSLSLMKKFPKFIQQFSDDLLFWIKTIQNNPSPSVLSSFKSILILIFNSNIKKYSKQMLQFIILYSIPQTQQLSYFLFQQTKPNQYYFQYLKKLFFKQRTLQFYNTLYQYLDRQKTTPQNRQFFDSVFFKQLQDDIRKCIINKDKQIMKKIFGIVNLLKTEHQLTKEAYRNIIDISIRQQKYSQGELKLIFESFNRLNQQKVANKVVNKKKDDKRFLISRLDF